MPTGPKHQMLIVDNEGYETGASVDCRCMEGADHREWDSESLNSDDAALIWGSRGMNEDDMFGYGEDELRSTLGGD